MEVQTESTYVVRMTRLEAARTLVAPEELQKQLRARLQTDTAEAEIIDGKTVTPALTAGRNGHSAGTDTPATRKAMRKYRQSTKRTACPQCGKPFKRLALHITKAHPSAAPTTN